jgi:hypothetical protein
MKHIGILVKRRFFVRFNPAVHLGWVTASSGKQNADMSRVGIGLALIMYGLIRGRSARKLIYRTSVDIGQGATIRVRQGRRPLAETAPIR